MFVCGPLGEKDTSPCSSEMVPACMLMTLASLRLWMAYLVISHGPLLR